MKIEIEVSHVVTLAVDAGVWREINGLDTNAEAEEDFHAYVTNAAHEGFGILRTDGRAPGG